MEQLQNISLSFKCDKAFDTLHPCEGGWYCNGCQKLVYDLRGKPEQKILDIFAENNYNLCGMFEADRIRVNMPLPKWQKWLAAAVLVFGFTGMHQTLLAQQIPEKIVIDTTGATDENMLFGGVSEEMAEFPGGVEKFYKYLKAQLVSDGSGKPGQKAFLTFVVEKNGALTDIKILRSPFSKEMNRRIVRLLERSPKWKPGMQLGNPVRQQYNMPIALDKK